jgi:hypothetical protein
MKRFLIILFLATGCGLNEDYIKQDRKDYDTFAPRVMKMIDETSLYDNEQKQDMRDRLEARNARIKAAEEYVK